MSNSLNSSGIICDSKMESVMMNHCSSSYRNNIYDLSYDSCRQIKSFSKISEKIMSPITMNIGDYVGELILH